MLPWDRPLSNFDIENVIREHTPLRAIFRGTFSLDELSNLTPRRGVECAIINLARSSRPGTHWCAYYKHGGVVCYYDPFGDLRPPRELVNYLSKCKIYYNVNREQEFDTVYCGQLCLCFLMIEYTSRFV